MERREEMDDDHALQEHRQERPGAVPPGEDPRRAEHEQSGMRGQEYQSRSVAARAEGAHLGAADKAADLVLGSHGRRGILAPPAVSPPAGGI